MIDCPNGDVRDALPDYLNDRLGAARRREVESHLAGCDACRDELSLLRAMRATMRRAPTVDVGTIAAAIAPYRAPARRGWGTSWRVAAAVVAIAAGGTAVALLRERAPTIPVDVSPYVAYRPTPHRDSARVVVAPPARETPAAVRTAPAPVPAASATSPELAMAGGAISDLSDGELSALVEGIDSLDGLPSTEVEGAEPVTIGTQEGI